MAFCCGGWMSSIPSPNSVVTQMLDQRQTGRKHCVRGNLSRKQGVEGQWPDIPGHPVTGPQSLSLSSYLLKRLSTTFTDVVSIFRLNQKTAVRWNIQVFVLLWKAVKHLHHLILLCVKVNRCVFLWKTQITISVSHTLAHPTQTEPSCRSAGQQVTWLRSHFSPTKGDCKSIKDAKTYKSHKSVFYLHRA